MRIRLAGLATGAGFTFRLVITGVAKFPIAGYPISEFSGEKLKRLSDAHTDRSIVEAYNAFYGYYAVLRRF
jgi:hypothetical protein